MRLLPQTLHRLRQRAFRLRAEDSLPHTISHQRLYIVPTQRGLAFLLALLLMLIASINYALSLGYALCFLLTGLFAATLLHTYRNMAGLTIQSIESEPCFVGQQVRFRIRVSNQRDRDCLGLRMSTAQARLGNLRVQAQSAQSVALTPAAQHRGWQSLGRLTLQSDWPLGLWTCWSYVHVPATGLVYPAPETPAPDLPSSAGESGAGRRRQDLQGDVSGLRPYQPGDSLGSIAWKTAARGQTLQVRDHDSPSGAAFTHLSLRETGRIDTEAQLSRLCAWVMLAEGRRQSYSLELPSLQLPRGQGSEQQRQALQALALHEPAFRQAS